MSYNHKASKNKLMSHYAGIFNFIVHQNKQRTKNYNNHSGPTQRIMVY